MQPIEMVTLLMQLGFIGLSAMAVYTDLDRGKVTNRNILAFLALGLGWRVWSVASGAEEWAGSVLIGVLGLMGGLLLYLMNYWAPGDGKLFFAACLAIPIHVRLETVTYTVMQLLIWAVGLTVVYAFAAHFRRICQHLRADIAQFREGWGRPGGPTWTRLARQGNDLALQIVAFLGLNSVLQALSPIRFGILQSLLLGLLLSSALVRLESRWRWAVFAASALPLVYFLWDMPLQAAVTLTAAYVAALASRLVFGVINRASATPTVVGMLSPGQFLADYVVMAQDGTVQILPRLSPSRRTGKRFIGPESGALGPNQVEWLRGQVERGRLGAGEVIHLQKSVPFAPFIALGAIAHLVTVMLEPVLTA